MDSKLNDISRRGFLRRSSAVTAAAGTFTVLRPELVRGAGKERLRAGLIGCGGRGTDAVVNMLEGTENVDIVAMGDLFEDKLETSLRGCLEAACGQEQVEDVDDCLGGVPQFERALGETLGRAIARAAGRDDVRALYCDESAAPP